MVARFFVDSPIRSDHATIVGSEAHHLQHVMRASVDDVIQLFDGSGREYSARITGMDRNRISVSVLDITVVDRELPIRLVVGSALPKGERQRWLTEKLVELGASELVPLRTSRSIVHPDKRATVKLHRTVIEASKQCGRNRLMQVSDLQSFKTYLEHAPPDARRLLADPSGRPWQCSPAGHQETYLAIGPEGGFTDDELVTASNAGWELVSLGPRILRIETACLALVARAIASQPE